MGRFLFLVLLCTGSCAQVYGQSGFYKCFQNSYNDTTSIRNALICNPNSAVENVDSLLNAYTTLYQASVKLNYHYGKKHSCYNLGIIYGNMQSDIIAMKYWKKLINMVKKEDHSGTFLAEIYLMIAAPYYTSDPGGKFLYWLKMAERQFENSVGDDREKQVFRHALLWDIHQRMARGYLKTGDLANGQVHLDFLLENVGTKDSSRIVELNIASYFKALCLKQYKKAVELVRTNMNLVGVKDKSRRYQFFFLMPQAFIGKKDYSSALAYVDSCRRFDRNALAYPDRKIFIDQQDIAISIQTGDYRRAVEKMNALAAYKDSLDRRNEMLITSHDRAELELDNYVTEIEKQHKRSQVKSVIVVFTIFLGVLTVFYLIRRFRIHNRSLRSLHRVEKVEVGNDIHDVINPALTYAKMLVSGFSLSDSVQQNNQQRAVQILDGAIHDVRRLSAWVRSTAEIDSFSSLLTDMFTRYTEAYGLQVEQSVVIDETALNHSVKSAMYFILEELILNTWKHAGATHCLIEISVGKPGEVILRYADNGTGFNFEQNYRGVGLASIRNRIKRIGALIFYHDKDVRKPYTYMIYCYIPTKNERENDYKYTDSRRSPLHS